jgi:GNAT superfamily N-acetyltransferase
MQFQLKKLDSSHISLIQNLADEASSEGFRFVQRTIDEWKNGVNRFSKRGEILIGIFLADKYIGIGGLNVDPYINDPDIGRIRHVYISQAHRRKGVATFLLKRLISFASNYFQTIRLLTDNPDASSFYESLGFINSSGLKVSHILRLDSNRETPLSR